MENIHIPGFKLNFEGDCLIKDMPYAPKTEREKLIKKFARFIVMEDPPQRPSLYKKTLKGFSTTITKVVMKIKKANLTGKLFQ